jgi:D-arabinose 1-dehydrogenase-like Zn-dependent alcohol dehydrogenase
VLRDEGQRARAARVVSSGVSNPSEWPTETAEGSDDRGVTILTTLKRAKTATDAWVSVAGVTGLAVHLHLMGACDCRVAGNMKVAGNMTIDDFFSLLFR